MGPLKGVKVIEFTGGGPGQFCAMMLAELGAEIIRIDRKGDASYSRFEVMARDSGPVSLDFEKPEGVQAVLRLIGKADVLIEGYCPGVMERIGLSPEVCHKLNKRLVYGRMSGWDQTERLSEAAGHVINCIALKGLLKAIGKRDTLEALFMGKSCSEWRKIMESPPCPASTSPPSPPNRDSATAK